MNEHIIDAIGTGDKTRRLALLAICLGVLMVTLDISAVNVALAAIRVNLGFSESSLVWVINGYFVPFAGLLLLSGRLGDRYGHRPAFLLSIVLFALASLGCGTADTSGLLVFARVMQGVAGAAILAVSLPLIMHLFDEASERARALAIFSAVVASGNSAGVLLGGVLTNELGWRWVFLVNLPIGALVCGLCAALRFHAAGGKQNTPLDVMGAVAITTSLMLAIFSVLNMPQAGWGSAYTVLPFCGALALMSLFLVIESRVPAPIISLNLFEPRNIRVSAITGPLWSGVQLTWSFITTLYLQQILGYDPLKVGLSFLPATLFMAIFSFGLSAPLVARFGVKMPLATGLLLVAFGLMLLAEAPVRATFATHVLPGMLLYGLGWGIANNPFLLGALSEASKDDYGLVSGVVNTSTLMGGSLALAFTVSLAAARTSRLAAAGASASAAVNGGYHWALAVSAMYAVAGAIISGLFLRSRPATPT